ncbi:dihydrolipoamide acetyltransferase component of pyruvate dehydrogenase complex [Actinomycetospora sp. NBRC 106375]|uniref:2-oxoglutarate dehydrogenase, E2 component, dihydrolipoamide succinyltransferase n=1 Tax=Actinomycetospora sp. NBRC 106375 TaxID=3032207 RepID=UPI0024A3760D|nr:2-oxoglutarate dehydrogenase, E2 component, dihydrolipoamide succinyltransferase [Actinomycetospora sp. NBRC 106375]GLZ47437.1 dihydrolipoamide acetyltransferase component of pyruvate dehydrogenase complex [Actinomycetospora sp. NBRC 106375]
MAYTVQMPALGESVTEGTVTRWLKQEGDHVDVDEPLLEVSTDKVDTEIPSPQAGVLQRIVAQEDDTVEVGGDLAVIGDEGESAGSSGGDGGGAAQPAESSQPEPAPEPEPEPEPAPQQSDPEPAAASSSSSGGSSSGGSSGGTTVEMPALGESVTEGTVTRWLKAVGDSVDVDEPLLEVSTDKVDTEIPSPVAGTVLELKAGEDDTVEVGGALAVIGDASQASGGGAAAPAQEQQAPAPAQEPAAQQTEQPSQPSQPSQPEPQQAVAASGADDYVSHETEQPTTASGPANAGATRPRDSSQGNGASAPTESGSPYVTPLVRKLAAERGVDLSTLSGTGVGGRIRKQDVVKAADEQDRSAAAPADDAPAQATASGGSGGGAVHAGEVQKPSASGSRGSSGAPAPDTSGLRGTTQKLSRRRATIAKRMVESLQVSAQLTTVVEADVTRIARLRDRAKADFQAREGVKLSFLPFMALATVEALKAHPSVNAMIDTEKGEVTYHGAEHLGIAVDSPAGLIVPVVHDAGDLNLAGLARKIADVAERTRANKITPDELSGGTFTITNTGSRGALIDTPIINQPQVGILGTGAVVKKPVVLQDDSGGDVIAVRSMAYLCLSYDHRIVDGADAARFLTTIKDRLEGGAFEGELGL